MTDFHAAYTGNSLHSLPKAGVSGMPAKEVSDTRMPPWEAVVTATASGPGGVTIWIGPQGEEDPQAGGKEYNMAGSSTDR